jgi:hypothetical protein
MAGRSRVRPVRYRRYRSPHHQHLRLDGGAAEAGAVGVEGVVGGAAVVVEGLESQLALAALLEIPVEAAAILLAGAVDTGHSA